MATGGLKITDQGQRQKGSAISYAVEADVKNNSTVDNKATTPKSLQPIWEMMFKIAPEPPADLKQMNLVISGSYHARRASTGDTDLCTDVTKPKLQTEAKFMDGDSGTLTCFVKNFGELDSLYVSKGTKTLSTSSDVGSNGWLNITEDSDPYSCVQGAGIYKQLLANITPTVGQEQAVGGYVAKMVHSGTGETKALGYWVDDPQNTSISDISVTAPTMTSHISGVKTLVSGQTIKVTYTVSNAVRTHYNLTRVGTITSTDGWFTANPLQNPSSAPANGASLTFTDVGLTVGTSKYFESMKYSIQTYNSKGVSTPSSVQTISGVRVDGKSTGPNRVTVGSITTDGYPSGYGGVYDNIESLLTGNYVNELQLCGGEYLYPHVDYSSYGGSPNYSTCTGTRGIMYKYPSTVACKGFYITLSGGNTGTGAWTANGSAVTSYVSIYIKIDGVTGWLDANAAFSSGNPVSNGAACMVSGNSTAISKCCTLGTLLRTGTLYVYISLPYNSPKTFSQTITIDRFND